MELFFRYKYNRGCDDLRLRNVLLINVRSLGVGGYNIEKMYSENT